MTDVCEDHRNFGRRGGQRGGLSPNGQALRGVGGARQAVTAEGPDRPRGRAWRTSTLCAFASAFWHPDRGDQRVTVGRDL